MERGYSIPEEGSTFDESFFYLGKPCKRAHTWPCGKTLRVKKTKQCPLCARLDAIERQNKARQDPVRLEKMRERVRRYRRAARPRIREMLRQQGLTSRGTPPKNANGAKPAGSPWERSLQKAIRDAGGLPDVARLVAAEQRRYWTENPKAKKAYEKQKRQAYYKWKMLTDPSYVQYHRQKSKRRKLLIRDRTALNIPGKAIDARHAEFGYCCAYCGFKPQNKLDLETEHVIPLKKDGMHALGNLLPTCESCNDSKYIYPVEAWYRSQPFFNERRWRKICRVLGWDKSSVGQMALL